MWIFDEVFGSLGRLCSAFSFVTRTELMLSRPIGCRGDFGRLRTDALFSHGELRAA